MPTVTLDDKGCRGCTLCSDTCPVDVFEFDEKTDEATVVHTEDCIGCLSCTYLCPSDCITITDVELIRPFHRSDRNGAFIEKFLQAKVPSKAITTEDWEMARGEVALYLGAFTEAMTEIIGRGQRAVGRRAGSRAASHLPEMYEPTEVGELLERLRVRHGSSFPFEHTISNGEVTLSITQCGMHDVLGTVGGKVGEHVLCHIFHEYWAGLLSSFTGTRHGCEVPRVGATCEIVLKPH